MKIGANLRRSRLAAKLSQQQVADHFGIRAPSVSEWESDKTRPDLSKLEELARLYKTSIGALFGEADTAGSGPGMQPILSWEHPEDLPPGEFVLIPRLGIRLSAGNGAEQVEIDFVHKQPQAFRADWIRARRLKPKKLASMTADGDSMEERIQHADALVVDTSQTEVIDGKVYALWYDGGERVKRLYRLPGGGLRIKSDNEDYPPIDLAPEQLENVRVIGRVVHVAGQGGL